MSQASRLILKPILRGNPVPLISTTGKFPVLRGQKPGGVSYLCGRCRTFEVLENLIPGQVWDLAFRCPECKGISVAPRRPPGTPFCKHTMAVWPIEGSVSTTIECNEWAVAASLKSVETYVKETGTTGVKFQAITDTPKPPTFDPATGLHLSERPPIREPMGADALSLTRLISRLRAVIGADLFDSILRSSPPLEGFYRGGPIGNRHPLAVWVRGSLLVAQAQVKRQRYVGNATVCLAFAVEMVERWQNHPSFPGFRKRMRLPKQFRHDLAVLETASYLADHGNGVSFPTAGGDDGGIPDIYLTCGPSVRMSVEVKTPDRLDDPPEPTDAKTAFSTLRNKIDDAGLSRGRQLGNPNGSIFVVTAVDLRTGDLLTLKTEATRLLNSPELRKSRLAAILIISRNVWISAGLKAGRSVILRPGAVFRNVTIARLIKNRSFTGPLRLENKSAN